MEKQQQVKPIITEPSDAYKRYYNPDGDEIMDEKIYGSNPTGFVNHNKSRYKWSNSAFVTMNANTWFPSEIDTSMEKKNFALLSENEKEIYKLTFAQLSFNDSAQEEYLSDFRALTSNRLIKTTLSLQISQESNHSNSYAVLLDACGNSEEVFNLYKHNDALNRKNKRIAEQFARHISGKTSDKLLLSAMASVNLEGIYFLLGFSYIYTLGDKVPGARDMIKFIARDELNAHCPFFSNIFKTIVKENNIDKKTIELSYIMLEEAVNIELEYGMYLLEKFPIMGLTKELIVNTIHNYANARLKAIGLNEIFPVSGETYLQKLVTKHLNMNEVKTNFFEGNVSNYSKSSIDMNNF